MCVCVPVCACAGLQFGRRHVGDADRQEACINGQTHHKMGEWLLQMQPGGPANRYMLPPLSVLLCLHLHSYIQLFSCVHVLSQASKLVQDYNLELLKRPGLVASDDDVIEFADLALDCVKTPGTRRPEMKEVARRLGMMLARMTAAASAGNVSEGTPLLIRAKSTSYALEGRMENTSGTMETYNGSSTTNPSLNRAKSTGWNRTFLQSSSQESTCSKSGLQMPVVPSPR